MKVTIISREIIKPSFQSIQHLKPHKLCLFDQLESLSYATCVLFYPNIISPDSNFSTISKTLTHLKKSLSETLNLYYIFSGRIKDDLYVHDFGAGTPFMESRVNCRMAEYFKSDNLELLNKLLPFPPNRTEINEPIPIPLLALQANVFSCGGLAFGACLCHKIGDGGSMFYLLSSWAALSRGCRDEVIKPNFTDIVPLFPPVNDFFEKYSTLLNQALVMEGNYVTKRFLFSTKAVENLRNRAAIREDLPKPTRNEAISCFIWKHVTEASWAVSGSRKAITLAHHAVNIRGKLKIQNPMGNLFWYATAVANTEQGTPSSMELPKLVSQLKEAMKENESLFSSIAEHGYKEGFGSELILKKLENLLSLLKQLDTKPEQLWFSNWKGFFNDVDFGRGKPFKIGVYGKVDTASSNMVFLVDSQWGKGVEATVTLEEKLMAVLERDINFLTFASKNPIISSL